MSGDVLIDASNLHAGGGVQVASSLINELLLNSVADWLPRADFRASTEVYSNLEPAIRNRVNVLDAKPRLFFRGGTAEAYDVAVRVFGPHYGPREGRFEISGLADPFLAPGWASKKLVSRNWASRAKYVGKRFRVRAYDHFWVESEAYARNLQQLKIPLSNVSVIPNAVSTAIVATGGNPRNLTWVADRPIRLLYPARPYRHKNHAILGEVGDILAKRGLRVVIQVTLDSHEWRELPEMAQRYTEPLGVLTQTELRVAYGRVHGVLFPTLLEVSSATPLESMALGLPLLASNRPFIAEQACDAAWYFEPRSPGSIADAVQAALSDPTERQRRVDMGLELAARRPTASDRLAAFEELIDGALRHHMDYSSGSPSPGATP